tara:strand:+ start:3145 stop:3510 length:366 start_codon:yes stop_codon:yes gene_type:complete
LINGGLQVQETAHQHLLSTKASPQGAGAIGGGSDQRFAGHNFCSVFSRRIAEIKIRAFRLLGRDPAAKAFTAQQRLWVSCLLLQRLLDCRHGPNALSSIGQGGDHGGSGTQDIKHYTGGLR